jgi:hypothetical protein
MYILWPYIYMEYTWHIPTIYLTGVPDVGGLTVDETVMRKKMVKKDQAKCSAEAQEGRWSMIK